MIQFNLLPSVKQEYVKTRRNKRVTLLIATLVAAATFGIMVILFVYVQFLQKNYSKNLSNDIKKQSNELEGIPELNKIITIQNQLKSLKTLHADKPVASRLIGYIQKFTPANVTIEKVDVDFDQKTIHITGAADTISAANVFADTLKFTTFQVKIKDPDTGQVTDGPTGNAFSKVKSVIDRDEKNANYELIFTYDPNIFSNAGEVDLIIPPNKITTRSETEKPGSGSNAIFQSPTNQTQNKTGQ